MDNLTKGDKMKRLVMCIVCGIVCGLFLIPAEVATATELVWAPLNPSFGGPSYNATWLMASAQAQNSYVETAAGYTRPDPFEDFGYDLERRYLSALSQKIIDEAFGEEGLLPEGQTDVQYLIGDYTIDITSNGQLTVVITDGVSGNSTTVAIPYF